MEGRTSRVGENKKKNHTKICKFKAKWEKTPNSLVPQGELDLSKPAKSIDTGKHAQSALLRGRHAIFPVRTDGGSPLQKKKRKKKTLAGKTVQS